MDFFQQIPRQLRSFGQNVSLSGLSLFDDLRKRRLKVALISYYYERPTQSGVGIHMFNLAKSLAKRNCEVHVFCIGRSGATYREHGVVVHPVEKVLITGMSDVSKKRLEYDLFESEVIKELLREHKHAPFDIIHTHGALVKSAFIFKKICNICWIHTFHAVEKLRMQKLSAEEKLFADFISWMEHTVSYTDGTIFVSQDLLTEGKHQYALKSTTVIPNGVDRTVYGYYPITQKNVLFIGRFSEEKGIHHLPQIISAVLRIKGTTFTAVCPSNTKGAKLRKIRVALAKLENMYPERLRIIESSVDPEQLQELYKNCQVYIQPSAYESFGLCILEAMATGRPVVAFNVGGISEVIGNAGFLVKNVDEMIQKVCFLLEQKNESIKIGLQASRRAQNFEWDAIAQKVYAYYTKIRGKRT